MGLILRRCSLVGGRDLFQVMDNSQFTFFGLSIRSQMQRRWLAFRFWLVKSDP